MPPDASVATTGKVYAPGTDGFPKIVPDGASERPMGTKPATIDQV